VKRAAIALALVGLALGAQPAAATVMPRGLELGLADTAFSSPEPALRDEWLERARSARANLVLLGVAWSSIAPATPPAGFDPADPADPAYDWEALDGAVRSATERGMQPLLAINFAPTWAEGPNRPNVKRAPTGTWLPQPRELGRFATALASRYSGRFVDPVRPGAGPLPRVRFFEIWAEENLAVHLTPQWRGDRPVAPQHYRAMLNAAYAAIHRADRGARVIVGGLSPYGDIGPRAAPAAGRIAPVLFWRSLLCLRGSRLRPVGCPDPAHFDIAAHNPINVGGPSRRALSPLDVSTPDLGRITSIVRKAVATRRALPARRKPFWATEIWWDSDPPDPHGVPARRHARFLTKSLFSLWRQGASAVVWWYLRDQSHSHGFNGTQQSGLYFRDGRPKLALRAFRFPFIAGRGRDGRLFVWGKAPAPGRLVVERLTERGWEPLCRPLAGRNLIFATRVDARGGFLARASQGSERSLPWRARPG
jgi:hypothetical protein